MSGPKQPNMTSTNWKLYYQILSVEEIVDAYHNGNHHIEVTTSSYYIAHAKGTEREGKVAYNKNFRNKRLAIKAVQRLYLREHGNLENVLLGD